LDGADERTGKIMSFAGSQSGAFANTIASDLRKK
jgi:hypothetical protein